MTITSSAGRALVTVAIAALALTVGASLFMASAATASTSHTATSDPADLTGGDKLDDLPEGIVLPSGAYVEQGGYPELRPFDWRAFLTVEGDQVDELLAFFDTELAANGWTETTRSDVEIPSLSSDDIILRGENVSYDLGHFVSTSGFDRPQASVSVQVVERVTTGETAVRILWLDHEFINTPGPMDDLLDELKDQIKTQPEPIPQGETLGA